jgi:UDP-glucose 4-epimerase
MKILVIGGAGYIGSHAVYELIRQHHEVVVMDNLSTGKEDNIHEEASFYLGNITEKNDLINVFKQECTIKKFDIVMHFAAKIVVPESVKDPLGYYHNNVEGVRLMLEVMNEFKIKNIVFSSTAAVYGNPVNPICHEEDIVKPINPYGASKLASEEMIKWVSKAHDMNYCIFRYFNVSGADKSGKIGLDNDNLTHLIPIVVQNALGLRDMVTIYGDDYDTSDGTCIRDYIHVSDIALAHVLGADYITKHNKSILLNLGSNEGYSVKQIINEVNKLKEVKYEIGPRREGDPAKLIASNKKAKEILGWKPKYTLEDIIVSDMKYREEKTLVKI